MPSGKKRAPLCLANTKKVPGSEGVCLLSSPATQICLLALRTKHHTWWSPKPFDGQQSGGGKSGNYIFAWMQSVKRDQQTYLINSPSFKYCSSSWCSRCVLWGNSPVETPMPIILCCGLYTLHAELLVCLRCLRSRAKHTNCVLASYPSI